MHKFFAISSYKKKHPMNRGVATYGNGLVQATWDLGMTRGQLPVVYTPKYVGQSDLWHSTFVPTIGKPLRLCHVPVDCPDYKLALQNERLCDDYSRYEPQYQEQFSKMCESVRLLTLAISSVTGDDEAMRLLHLIDSLWQKLIDRILDNKRQKSQRRFGDLLMPIQLRDGWAFFLEFFDDILVSFLLTDDHLGDELIEQVIADRFRYGLIGSW